jgi:hypothetical protein
MPHALGHVAKREKVAYHRKKLNHYVGPRTLQLSGLGLSAWGLCRFRPYVQPSQYIHGDRDSGKGQNK